MCGLGCQLERLNRGQCAARLDRIARGHETRSGIVENEGLTRTEYANDMLMPVHAAEICSDAADHAGRERHGRGGVIVISEAGGPGANPVPDSMDGNRTLAGEP